jgi:hypothetical protein
VTIEGTQTVLTGHGSFRGLRAGAAVRAVAIGVGVGVGWIEGDA